MAEKEVRDVISYVLGIISIVMAFFNSPAGLIFGIIGFVQSKKQKTDLSKKAKKLNTIGIILSAIILAISIALTAYITLKGLSSNLGGLSSSFPLA
jgi:hypothetical protein